MPGATPNTCGKRSGCPPRPRASLHNTSAARITLSLNGNGLFLLFVTVVVRPLHSDAVLLADRSPGAGVHDDEKDRCRMSVRMHERQGALATAARSELRTVGTPGRGQGTPTSLRMNRLVLVVEDYESARELYAKCLGLAGFRVALASDGAEAVDQATRLLPEVIVMDVFLPRLDGLEATRRLKADDRTKDIPVIACTAGASTEKHPDLFYAYLEKPCLPSALIAAVRAALGHRFPDGRLEYPMEPEAVL